MKKLAFALLIAVLALTAASLGTVQAAGPASPTGTGLAQAATTPTSGGSGVPQTLTVTLTQQNNSGENGTATITAVGDNSVRVMVQLSNSPTTPQPAHIHKGTCANLDPVPAYPLNNVVNGMSDTTVPAAIADLAKGGYAINVHKSATEVSTYVSCGDITAQALPGGTTGGTGGQTGGGTPGMPTTGNSDQINLLLAMTLLALLIMGAGLTLVRRRA